MHDIDRKTASRLLKVSMRTVDRYINKNKLSIEKRDGRIWLDKKEIIKLKNQNRIDSVDRLSTSKMSIDNMDVIPVDTSIDNDQEYESESQNSSSMPENQSVSGNFGRKTRSNREISSEDRVYKKLFEEAQQEVKQKQERLEMANYRVGQLEARIKDSIPLLDYNRDLEKERLEKEEIHKNLDANQTELEKLMIYLKDERFNKRVYLIILFILLLLQPLWFFFPMK